LTLASSRVILAIAFDVVDMMIATLLASAYVHVGILDGKRSSRRPGRRAGRSPCSSAHGGGARAREDRHLDRVAPCSCARPGGAANAICSCSSCWSPRLRLPAERDDRDSPRPVIIGVARALEVISRPMV